MASLLNSLTNFNMKVFCDAMIVNISKLYVDFLSVEYIDIYINIYIYMILIFKRKIIITSIERRD